MKCKIVYFRIVLPFKIGHIVFICVFKMIVIFLVVTFNIVSNRYFSNGFKLFCVSLKFDALALYFSTALGYRLFVLFALFKLFLKLHLFSLIKITRFIFQMQCFWCFLLNYFLIFLYLTMFLSLHVPFIIIVSFQYSLITFQMFLFPMLEDVFSISFLNFVQ